MTKLSILGVLIVGVIAVAVLVAGGKIRLAEEERLRSSVDFIATEIAITELERLNALADQIEKNGDVVPVQLDESIALVVEGLLADGDLIRVERTYSGQLISVNEAMRTLFSVKKDSANPLLVGARSKEDGDTVVFITGVPEDVERAEVLLEAHASKQSEQQKR